MSIEAESTPKSEPESTPESKYEESEDTFTVSKVSTTGKTTRKNRTDVAGRTVVRSFRKFYFEKLRALNYTYNKTRFGMGIFKTYATKTLADLGLS